MEKKFWLLVLVAAVAGALGAMAWYGMAKPGADQQAFAVQGITNLDSLTLKQNLVVGGTASVTGKVTASGSLAVAGNITMTGSLVNSIDAITMTDNVLIDGQADAVQLTVQGHSTQNEKTFVIENSAGADKFTVDNSGNIAAAGDVDATGAVKAGTYVQAGTYGVLGSYLRVGTFAQFSPAVPITVTDGGTILPAGTYQPLYAETAVGAGMGVTGMQAGYLCVLVNTAANNITISDTVNAALPGNVVLGEGDSLVLIFDGTQWVALATSNN